MVLKNFFCTCIGRIPWMTTKFLNAISNKTSACIKTSVCLFVWWKTCFNEWKTNNSPPWRVNSAFARWNWIGCRENKQKSKDYILNKWNFPNSKYFIYWLMSFKMNFPLIHRLFANNELSKKNFIAKKINSLWNEMTASANKCLLETVFSIN